MGHKENTSISEPDTTPKDVHMKVLLAQNRTVGTHGG